MSLFLTYKVSIFQFYYSSKKRNNCTMVNPVGIVRAMDNNNNQGEGHEGNV